MNELEVKLADLFGKLPVLSPGGKQTAAKVFPWLAIVLGCLGIFSWLGSIRMFFAFSGMAGAAGGMMWLSWIAAPLIQLAAIVGGYLMRQKNYAGWRLVFYSLLVGAVVNLLSLMPLGLLFNLLFAYFLFQIREYYIEN